MNFRIATLATSLALLSIGSTQAANTSFSNIYFFGDSLSDTGAFAGQTFNPTDPTSPTLGAKARWLMGYDANWTDVFAARFGLSSVANNQTNNPANTSATGNNYAQGGAQAQTAVPFQFPNAHLGPGGLPIEDVQAQYADYLAQHGGKIDPNAAYSVWIGGNDLTASVVKAQAVLQTGGTQAAAQTAATQVLTDSATVTAGLARTLNANGAALVIVPNIPDPSRAPTILFSVIDQTLKSAAKQSLGGNPTSAQISAQANVIAQATGIYPTVLGIIGTAPIQTEADRQAAYQRAITAVATAISNLSGGATPVSAIADQMSSGMATLQGTLASATTGLNQLVDMGLQGTHGIVRPNINALFNEVLNNPTRFGITNIASPYCAGDAIQCSGPQINAQNYVFTDDFHPSPKISQLVGQYISDIVASPAFAGAIPEASLTASRQLGDTLTSRYEAIRASHRAVGTVSAWASGNYRPDTLNYAALNGKAKGELYTVGGDYQLSDTLSLGISASHAGGTTSVNSLGNIDNSSTLMAFSANWKSGNVFVDGDLQIGDISMTSRRNTVTGTKNGDVGGTQLGYRIHAGMDYPLGPVTMGPRVGISFAQAKVQTVAEDGVDSTAQFFRDQNVKSLTGSLGWQVNASYGNYSPYARVDYVKEFKNGDRKVTAGLNSMPGDFTVNLGKPDSSWFDARLGVTTAISKTVSAWGQIGATSGRKNGNQSTATVGVSASF